MSTDCKESVHKAVVKFIEAEEWNFEETLVKLADKFPDERYESLRSILNQEYQKRVKRTHSWQTSEQKRKEVYNTYVTRVKDKNYTPASGVIVQIAQKNRFSSAQTAKIVLEESLRRQSGTFPSKTHVSQLLKNPALLEDGKLATELMVASLKDDTYGFTSECIKSAIGSEYERKAKRMLLQLGLTYQDETELRQKGYDKTPDIKLDIPFAYKGHVINWIESKALFGDEDNHPTYLKEQLWSYWNRYGSGMVIYWFGYIDELDNNRDKGIMVCGDFPKIEDIQFCDPLNPEFDEDVPSNDDEEDQEENNIKEEEDQ